MLQCWMLQGMNPICLPTPQSPVRSAEFSSHVVTSNPLQEADRRKQTTSDHLVNCQKNTRVILKKLPFECLKMATCFENSISDLALRYSIHDLSRETWRGKKPCFPLELLLLLRGEVMEWQCDSPLLSWHSHLDHARKFLRVNYEL